MPKTKPKVLLIEDDPDQIDLYSARFSIGGIDLLVAQDGKSGIEKALTDQPDLILLDIVMDDIDGIEVLKMLKSNQETKKIPVIMLSNLTKKELIQKSKQLGAMDFWSKTDVLPAMMVTKIKKILKT